MATRLATWEGSQYKSLCHLARLSARGFASPKSTIQHSDLRTTRGVFIGDRVTIFGCEGTVNLEEGVHLYGDITIETGEGGVVRIGEGTHIQPRCTLAAFESKITMGKRVEIAPNCAFYPYDHCFAPGESIRSQGLSSRGDIVLEDDVWLGCGVIVLQAVRIGEGAVIGAGAVVTKDIPPGAIAAGVPARVVGMRGGSDGSAGTTT